MMLRVAVAVAPDGTLCDAHFGDAPFFELYDLGDDGAEPVSRMENPFSNRGSGAQSDAMSHASSHHDAHHAAHSASKAAGIGTLLIERGVRVLASRRFGQNIRRIRRSFVPTVIRSESLADALGILVGNYQRIRAAWDDGPERSHLVLAGVAAASVEVG